MSLDFISIRGAREHNLKGFDLEIPRDKLVVITGLSGSGKSSLAFDTIYAEGQRRYVESLSAYARQFLGQMDKPDVDHIEGLSPAVSIDQKTTSKNPRSTVGTVTEIYDYLRLLYARVGIPHCPICGRPIERQTSDQIVDRILELAEGTKFQVLAPVVKGRKGEYGKLLDDLKREGFTRVRVDKEARGLDEEIVLDKKYKHDIDVVIDRLVMKDGVRTRLADSVETALRLSNGSVLIAVVDGDEQQFSQALACPVHGNISMDELAPRDFSFNSPYGACPDCNGLGSRLEADPDLVVPDTSLTLAQGAIAPFHPGMNYYPALVAAAANHLGVSVDTPWAKLPKKVQQTLLNGLGDTRIRVDYVTRDGRETHWYSRYEGALSSTMRRFEESESENVKDKLREYLAVIPCKTCGGARLKPSILAVTVGGKNIHDVTVFSAQDSLAFFEALELSERDATIAQRIVKEILERLRFLVDVGLDYLTLERATATLSGGEAQRIRLATQIGAGLMGVLYILDEPSIGLHQRDNARLIGTMERLRDLGNTVIVVEHDEETIRAADFVVDMGPGAGEHGGEIVCVGPPEQILACPDSLTAAYLSGAREIAMPEKRRKPGKGAIVLKGATEHNLKNIDLDRGAGHAVGRHGCERQRQELAHHRYARAGHGEPPPARAASCGSVQEHQRTRARGQDHRHRPVTHRPYASFESGDVHRAVGRRALAVRLDPRGEAARLRAGTLQLQRRRRPVRGVQGRRPDQDRDALPARRLRAVRGVQGRSLQPGDPPGHLQGQDRERRPRHDRRRGVELLREHPADQAQAPDALRRGVGLRAPRSTRNHALGR